LAIKSLKPNLPPAATRERRMTLAIEPRVAELVRHVVRHEHILLSEFLEQAVVAWIRRWRPTEYSLEIDGPEGPPPRTQIIALGDGVWDDKSTEPVVGRATQITRAKAKSMFGFAQNPGRRPTRPSKPKRPKR
jgi:hypothetical protein